jgi:hypothetical protein
MGIPRQVRRRSLLAVTSFLVVLPLAQSHYSVGNTASQKLQPAKETVTVSPAAKIRPASTDYRFPVGQTYVYNAEWHMFNAGTASVHVEPSEQGQHAVVIADSSGMVSLFFKVHDRFRTTIDPQTFCSRAISKHTEEGSRKRDTEIRFDYTRRKSVLQEKNLKTGENKQVEHDIPSCVTDSMSGFFYLSSLPLESGASYIFPLNDGGQTGEITAKVEGREQIKTSAGTFNAVRVAAVATGGPLRNKGRLLVWYSDDAQHVPVQMQAHIKWGTLTVRLLRLEKN